ncbi:hypothetical protein DXH95_14415 [Sphingorhabdus pulchriflava]|uniref:Glycosyltransferase RgtA/B/C/D-like domain-containing protein n=1 Tax=Sphingorhabdus pulchriflava TaxID=2292257 RepID=A0A371B1M4_9SPHN|nr:hypothetical protein [Sphingorhabdus pulchriflava]RDV01485.1 hypothetical protein DXH95_14415 [Sphingorhabdus pulchriflava]
MAETTITKTSKHSWDAHHWIAGAIVLVATLQFHLIFVQGFNWDEFYFLSQVHAAENGTLQIALNTIHTRLFFWLPLLPDEIVQLRTARVFMLAAELSTGACIIGLARRFTDMQTAMLAGLAYISAGYVFLHGASFRVDPIVTALLMAALLGSATVRQSWRSGLAIALLIAVAGATTIKAVFFAPAFAGIWLMRWSESTDRQRTAIWMASTTVCAVLFFGVIYGLHSHNLAIADAEASRKMVSNAGEKMFSMGLFPRGQFLIKQGFIALIFSATLLAAPVAIGLQKRTRIEEVVLIAFWLPLLSLAIYRNSFPYFYAFIMAPATVAAAAALMPVVRRYGALPLALLLLGNGAWLYWNTPKDMQVVQARVLHSVHAIFPKPVAYIDFSSMISSFPKQGFFMSGWGMDNYRDAGQPVFAEILQSQTVPLVIANHDSLDAALRGSEAQKPLLDADAQILLDNYVHHWGPIWLAGREIDGPAGQRTINIAIPGIYTVEGSAITIAGIEYEPGDKVVLGRGPQVVERRTEKNVVLRFGRGAIKPSAVEPKLGRFGVFSDF